jgi:hypothetical protein
MALPDVPLASVVEPARPLRSVFADLAGEDGGDPATVGPAEVLGANGHADLSDGLVTEAVVNYADTAPFEVAEHLAPFVRANSSVPTGDTSAAPELDWFGLLATAPRVADLLLGPEALDAAAIGQPEPGSGAPAVSVDADVTFGRGDLRDHGDRDESATGPVEPADGVPVPDDPGGAHMVAPAEGLGGTELGGWARELDDDGPLDGFGDLDTA